MKDQTNFQSDRRKFIKTSAAISAATALGGLVIPHVHAQDKDDKIGVALIGCGGRGPGAAADALNVPGSRTSLKAMADVFDHKLDNAYISLKQNFGDNKDKLPLTKDQQYIGFDSFKKAMDTLKPGEICILATPLAFRWVHYQYAIERGLTSSWRSRSLPMARARSECSTSRRRSMKRA